MIEYERGLEGEEGTEEEEDEGSEEKAMAVAQQQRKAGGKRKGSGGAGAVPRQGSGQRLLQEAREEPLPAASPVARSRLIQMASSHPGIQRIASKERFASPPALRKFSSGHQRLKLSRGGSANSVLTALRPASQPQLNLA